LQILVGIMVITKRNFLIISKTQKGRNEGRTERRNEGTKETLQILVGITVITRRKFFNHLQGHKRTERKESGSLQILVRIMVITKRYF
jgi:hypothetical protein